MLGNAQGAGLHIKHQQKIIYKEKIHDTWWVSGGYLVGIMGGFWRHQLLKF
jgi:hypothetical protein